MKIDGKAELEMLVKFFTCRHVAETLIQTMADLSQQQQQKTTTTTAFFII
jgi:hypothetical protein